MDKTNAKISQGFTIVELLIVIVVVGLLAAISIFAYSGAQERARSVSSKSIILQVAKAVSLYAVENGNLPASLAEIPTISTIEGASLDYVSDTSSSPATWCVGDSKHFYDSINRVVGTGSCIPGLISTISTVTLLTGVQTLVFVGDPSDKTSHYAFDFRPSISTYAYMPSATSNISTGPGVIKSMEEGLAVVYYVASSPVNVYVGQRFSLNEMWRAPFKAEAYSTALTLPQINSVIARLKYDLQRT